MGRSAWLHHKMPQQRPTKSSRRANDVHFCFGKMFGRGRKTFGCGEVHYTEEYLQDCINQDHDALPIKLADGKVSIVSRFITANDKRTTITTNWSEFRLHANIHEGDICAFYFKRKARRTVDDRDYRL